MTVRAESVSGKLSFKSRYLQSARHGLRWEHESGLDRPASDTRAKYFVFPPKQFGRIKGEAKKQKG